jgi:hypothetical protein
MKKIVIVGSIVAIVILSMALLFHHSQRPSHQLLSGTWMQQDSLGALVLRPGGKYHWSMYSQKIQHDSEHDWIPKDASQWLYEGTWDLKDRVLVLNITFADARNTTNVEVVGAVDNYRVIKVDGIKLAIEKDGVTTDFHR